MTGFSWARRCCWVSGGGPRGTYGVAEDGSHGGSCCGSAQRKREANPSYNITSHTPLRNTKSGDTQQFFAASSSSVSISHDTMGKGKNHDRKANPGFGKVKSKSGTSTGEFTLKRVKGQSHSPSSRFHAYLAQARTFTAMQSLLPESRCSTAARP